MAEADRRATHWSWLGRIAYDRALELQLAAREELARGEGPERLLLLEHPHVYTLGRNASERDVLLAEGERAALGVEIRSTDRGGQVTYHGPGQLVAYPILDLNPDRRDLRRYVGDLQEAIVATLADFGLAAAGGVGETIGVWVGPRKIASIGVHLARWRTTHGLALNVSTELALFSGIVPCGMSSVEMTSMARELGSAPGLEAVARRLVGRFAERFDRELVPDPAFAERGTAVGEAAP